MQKYNAWKNTNLINTHIITGPHTVNTHANSLCTQDKITQTHEHTPKHDGEGLNSVLVSGHVIYTWCTFPVLAIDFPALESVTPPSPPFIPYIFAFAVQCIVSADNSMYLLQDWILEMYQWKYVQ